MTKQETYEAIRAHFRQPGAELSQKQKEGCTTACFYRHPETGAACAIGCLIPDELYDPSFDAGKVYVGTSIEDLFDAAENGDQAAEKLVKFLDFDEDESLGFASSAQRAHDAATTVADFIARLDEIAAAYDLLVVR